MGDVFLAWDRKHHRYAAIKVLKAKLVENSRGQRRFQREIELNRRLEHPHLARALEAGKWKQTPFLAMEFVPGSTLYSLVQKHGPIDPYWACRWMADVASALDYIHQGGVIHRDIKPSNAIVTPERHAKLLDLGLARWFDDDHNEARVVGVNRVIGSFDYMAPEQTLDSARADARSDIYSLGCMLYFLLAGHPPFRHAADRVEKAELHRTAPPPDLGAERPSLPTRLVKEVHRMMAKDPRDRYSVAAEVEAALSDWVERFEEDARTPSLPDEWFPDAPPEPAYRPGAGRRKPARPDGKAEPKAPPGVWRRIQKFLGVDDLD
jgi:serine/threonine-protein kinase